MLQTPAADPPHSLKPANMELNILENYLKLWKLDQETANRPFPKIGQKKSLGAANQGATLIEVDKERKGFASSVLSGLGTKSSTHLSDEDTRGLSHSVVSSKHLIQHFQIV